MCCDTGIYYKMYCAGALLFGPMERAWATLRAAAGFVASIARDTALQQDPPRGPAAAAAEATLCATAGTPAAAGEGVPAGRVCRPGGPPAGGVHRASISATHPFSASAGAALGARAMRGK